MRSLRHGLVLLEFCRRLEGVGTFRIGHHTVNKVLVIGERRVGPVELLNLGADIWFRRREVRLRLNDQIELLAEVDLAKCIRRI